MTFLRLRTADWVAMIAALALLMTMAADWYSTHQGDAARRVESQSQNAPPGEGGQVERELNQDARIVAEGQEKNAWQEHGLIDRVILIVLLATVALAVGAAFLRAAGRRFESPLTPSALAAIGAAAGALLVTYRIFQKPGLDAATTIKAGVPLTLVALGAITFASARGLKHEGEGTQFRALPEPPEPPPEPAPE